MKRLLTTGSKIIVWYTRSFSFFLNKCERLFIQVLDTRTQKIQVFGAKLHSTYNFLHFWFGHLFNHFHPVLDPDSFLSKAFSTSTVPVYTPLALWHNYIHLFITTVQLSTLFSAALSTSSLLFDIGWRLYLSGQTTDICRCLFFSLLFLY